MSTTTRQGRPTVAWGSWNGGTAETARGKRRRRGETLRRLESLEDRRLLSTVSSDPLALLTFAGDGAAADALTVSVSGTDYTLTSASPLAIGPLLGGVSVVSSTANSVTLTGISGLKLEMNFASSTAAVQSTDVATQFDTAAGSNGSSLTVGDAGSLGGIAAPITVTNSGAALGVGVAVDGSADTAGGAWTLQGSGAGATLSPIGTGGSLAYTPPALASLTLDNAAGQANGLTVDFASGNPLPGSLNYNGGWSTSSANASDLVLVGAGASFANEFYTPSSTGSGTIQLDGNQINLSGIAPHSVYDTVPAANYFFNDTSSPADGVLISDGANSTLTGNNQTLEISSLNTTTPGFTDTHVANKGSVVVNQNFFLGGYSVTVNYDQSKGPVAGLNAVTINQSVGSDSATLTSLAPGAAWALNQGPGDDTAFLSLAGTAGTTSTTLDGGPGTDLLTIDAGGAALSGANFFTNPGGSVTIQGAILPGGPITYNNYEGVTVNDVGPALDPTVTAVPVNGVEGQALVHALVATFTSSAPATAADFVATIDWNTASSTLTSGNVVQDANNPSIFYVYGNHTYYAPGTAIPTKVTVRSLPKTTEQLIGNTHVQFVRPGSDPTAPGASSASTASIVNAPLNVSVNTFNGIENTPIAAGNVVVATFTDLAGIDPSLAIPTSVYTATINWGDGSAAVGAVSITQNGTSSQYIVTAAPHTYAVPGSYPVTVNVAKTDGLLPPSVVKTGVGSNFAVIADAPLTALAPPTIAPVVEGTQMLNVAIGSFTDGDPLATVSEFTATVDWGDGTGTQLAQVVKTPSGTFNVVGSHTYATAIVNGGAPTVSGPGPFAPVSPSGTYPVSIVVRDVHGSAVNLTNTATVNALPLSVFGSLNPNSDSGISNSDGVTNVTTPTFNGWSDQGHAQVFLYASKDGGPAAFLGSTVTDATGAWSFTATSPLADGGYVVQAQAYSASGHTVSALTTLTPNLVIDTVGPKVTDVLFDNVRGRVIVSYQDFGGVADAGVGVVGSTMRDANNYRFFQPNQSLRRWQVTSLDVYPGTNVGEQTVAVVINGGRGIRGGKYAFTINSVDPSNLSGIQDVAGNALDGEYYGFFPSGNNVNGGNFVANLDAIHHTIFPARSVIGPATPVSPPGRPATGAKIGWNGQLLFPSNAQAARPFAARPAALARPQLAAHALRTR